MCLISVPNLKEIHLGEGCMFFLVQSYCFKSVRRRVEEKYEENRAIFRNAYFKNYLADFLQIWYAKSCNVYRGHKICEFDRNRFSSYRDMRC